MKIYIKVLPIIFGVIASILSLFIGVVTGANFLIYMVFNGQETLFRIVLIAICVLIGFVVYKITKNQIKEKDMVN